jgi:hypothetical protein
VPPEEIERQRKHWQELGLDNFERVKPWLAGMTAAA